MNDATANVLHKALQQESQGIVIILEDTKRDIDKFLEKHEKIERVLYRTNGCGSPQQ